MSKISKRLIIRIADKVLLKEKIATQMRIHDEIERYLGLSLSRYEKTRITLILEKHYRVKRRKIDPKTKRKVIYFTF